MVYDIVIIGSGPARITSSIYAKRANLNVLVIEKAAFGGLITHSPKIEKIEVTRRGKVRRAKLNYLRERVGKAAKIKEAR